MEKVLLAFPEYSSKIKGEHLTAQTMSLMCKSSTQPELVTRETRYLSENEFVTYQEFTNGAVYTAFGFVAGKNIVESETENAITYSRLNVWLHTGGSDQALLVENIGCALQPGKYSAVGKGTVMDPQDYDALNIDPFFASILEGLLDPQVPSWRITSYNQYWTGTAPAHVEYSAIFTMRATDMFGAPLTSGAYLLVKIGPMEISVSANWASIES